MLLFLYFFMVFRGGDSVHKRIFGVHLTQKARCFWWLLVVLSVFGGTG